MPNVEEQEKKTIELSPIGNVDETTNNIPETNDERRFSNKKNVVNREDCSDSRNETKRERGSNTSDREKKMFGTVSAKTAEAKQHKEQVTHEATRNRRPKRK